MTRTVPILIGFLAALLNGCSPIAGETDFPAAPSGPAFAELVPDSASAGVPRTISIWGDNTDWRPGEVDVDFGEGVAVGALIVDSSFHLTAQVEVADSAIPGSRDVLVRWNQREVLLRDSFFVEAGSIALSPARAALGDTTVVEITGWSTIFQTNHTIVSFGPEVNIEAVEVLSSSRLNVTVHVPHRSRPGPVDVAVYNPGLEVYTLKSGFVVDRDANEMTIEPAEADQGETLSVRLYAEDASFEPGLTELDMGTGVVVESLEVSNRERLIATIRIGNNAVVGLRDVEARTTGPEGVERRILLDGFTLYPVAADPLRARVSLSFGIARTHDADACDFSTSVYASAVFYEPNDFPCPSSGAMSSLAVPPHFDTPGTGFTMTGGSTDCPASKTFDAGPFVEFVSDENVVTLERYVHPYTGRVNYRGVGLDIPDYRVDTIYDLHTPGGTLGISDLPPWQIPEVLITLPRVYTQHGPDYCNLQHDLTDPLEVTWDPAGTYDLADMYLYLLGPAQDEGVPIMMLYPWDDGAYVYSPAALSFFTEGPAMLLQNAYRQTRFDVPGSEFVNAGFGTSQILWRGNFYFVTQD